jgi:hypothetical protein
MTGLIGPAYMVRWAQLPATQAIEWGADVSPGNLHRGPPHRMASISSMRLGARPIKSHKVLATRL